MILDLRSGTEWLPFYTGESNDRRIRVAREPIWRRVEVSTRTLGELLDDLLLVPRERAAEVGDLVRRAVGEGR